jgi:hypothetical protein
VSLAGSRFGWGFGLDFHWWERFYLLDEELVPYLKQGSKITRIILQIQTQQIVQGLSSCRVFAELFNCFRCDFVI